MGCAVEPSDPLWLCVCVGSENMCIAEAGKLDPADTAGDDGAPAPLSRCRPLPTLPPTLASPTRRAYYSTGRRKHSKTKAQLHRKQTL